MKREWCPRFLRAGQERREMELSNLVSMLDTNGIFFPVVIVELFMDYVTPNYEAMVHRQQSLFDSDSCSDVVMTSMMNKTRLLRPRYYREVVGCSSKDIEVARTLDILRQNRNWLNLKPVLPDEIFAWRTSDLFTTPRWAAWFFESTGRVFCDLYTHNRSPELFWQHQYGSSEWERVLRRRSRE